MTKCTVDSGHDLPQLRSNAIASCALPPLVMKLIRTNIQLPERSFVWICSIDMLVLLVAQPSLAVTTVSAALRHQEAHMPPCKDSKSHVGRLQRLIGVARYVVRGRPVWFYGFLCWTRRCIRSLNGGRPTLPRRRNRALAQAFRPYVRSQLQS